MLLTKISLSLQIKYIEQKLQFNSQKIRISCLRLYQYTAYQLIIYYQNILKPFNQISKLIQPFCSVSQINSQHHQSLQNPQGQFMATISSKQHQVTKFMSNDSKTKCLKVINLQAQNQRFFIYNIKASLLKRKEHLRQRQNKSSLLQVQQELKIYQKQDLCSNRIILKVETPFCQYPTLYDMFRKQSITKLQQIKRDSNSIRYFITELLELMLRNGGIDDYMYTPQNIFGIIIQQSEKVALLGKLKLNIVSFVGLRLILGIGRLCKEDFAQIYPLLPVNFFIIKDNCRELDKIMKKRAFAFLILCFIIKKVPKIIDIQQLEILVSNQKVKQLISKSKDKLKLALKVFKPQIDIAKKQTGIDFGLLFQMILIDNAQISWNTIISLLFSPQQSLRQQQFTEVKKISQNLTQKYSKQVLLRLWSVQPNRSYYEERDYNIPAKPSSQIENSDTVIYFLTKFNINFHKFFKYSNFCSFILSEDFSSQTNILVMNLIQVFDELRSRKQRFENKQIQNPGKGNQSQINEKLSQKIVNDKNDSIQELLNFFNPFSLKSKAETEILKNQLNINYEPHIHKEFLTKITSPSDFLTNALRKEQIIKTQHGGRIVISNPYLQSLSEFCDNFEII